MTLTFTVTADPTNEPPRTMLEIEEDDTTRVLDSVVLFRDGVSLRFEPILSDRYAVAYDYDAPFDVEATYRADVVETSTLASFSETWSSVAAWTGSGWATGSGVVSSSTPAASIYRDVASSTITKVAVTSPQNLTIELADSEGTTVGSVTVLPSGYIVVAGNGTSSSDPTTDDKATPSKDAESSAPSAATVEGTGSFTITLTADSMTVAGTTPAPWTATVALNTSPTVLPGTRVRLVAPEVTTLIEQVLMGNYGKPTGVAVNASGDYVVADAYLHQIRKYNSADVLQWTTGSFGSGSGQFNTPTRVAFNAAGDVVVADSGNNRIQKFNGTTGAWISSFGSLGTGNGQFNTPIGLAFDGSGNLWVVDVRNERVQKLTVSGSTYAYSSQFGSSGSGNGQFAADGASDIGVDASNNLYVTDWGNDRVQKFNSSGVYQSQFGTAGADAGQFNNPSGIVVDASSNIWVVDTGNERLQKFSSAFAYLGSVAITNPTALSKDASGKLWVVGEYYNVISKYYNGPGQTDDIAVYVHDNDVPLTATDTATLSPTGDQAGAWLTNALIPDLAVRFAAGADHFIASSSRRTGQLKTSTVAIEIEGSSDYLTPTTGARRKETWPLDVVAITEDAREQMVALLANDAPLSLRLPATGYAGLAPGFYSVGDVDPERSGLPFSEHAYVFSLPLTPNRAPIVKPLNQWNMDALAQTGATMDEVNTAYTTMNDLLVGP